MIHPGLTTEEFACLLELDRKEIEGIMTRQERKEADTLLKKVQSATRQMM